MKLTSTLIYSKIMTNRYGILTVTSPLQVPFSTGSWITPSLDKYRQSPRKLPSLIGKSVKAELVDDDADEDEKFIKLKLPNI